MYQYKAFLTTNKEQINANLSELIAILKKDKEKLHEQVIAEEY